MKMALQKVEIVADEPETSNIKAFKGEKAIDLLMAQLNQITPMQQKVDKGYGYVQQFRNCLNEPIEIYALSKDGKPEKLHGTCQPGDKFEFSTHPNKLWVVYTQDKTQVLTAGVL